MTRPLEEEHYLQSSIKPNGLIRKGVNMEITINVDELDVHHIIDIGLKPWAQTTVEERREYDRLINLYGTKVLQEAITQKGNRP